MKQIALSLVVIGSFFFSPLPAPAGTTDYALMSASPYNSEIALARARLEKFLYKANAKKRAILAQTPVVAIEAAVLTAGEVAPLLQRIEAANSALVTEGVLLIKPIVRSRFSCCSTAVPGSWFQTMVFSS